MPPSSHEIGQFVERQTGDMESGALVGDVLQMRVQHRALGPGLREVVGQAGQH